MKETKTKGMLIIEKIDFNRIFTRRVGKNNKYTGKISVPRDLIGKTVYVIVGEDGS